MRHFTFFLLNMSSIFLISASPRLEVSTMIMFSAKRRSALFLFPWTQTRRKPIFMPM